MLALKRSTIMTACCCGASLILSALSSQAVAPQGATGTIKIAVAAAGDASTHPAALPGARFTLVNRDVSGKPLEGEADASGNFAFTDLPAANYVLTAEAAGLAAVTREVHLTSGAALKVEIVLMATVSETVTVRDEEGPLSTSETTTSNVIRERTLQNAPLRAENYQSALPLTPGVVRDSKGLDHIKGAGSGESAYTVDGVDVTDPATGNLAFDIPIEAAASVQIEENPYSAETGRFTGGATNLETKGGSDAFKFAAARFFPTLRYILSGPVDSFRPRLTFSGPIIPGRLFFLESVEYRFTRTRVPGLAAPFDDETSETFNSFTQFDLIFNKNNQVKFITSFFPRKDRNVGLNTFNPQETTPNTKERGALVSISDQAIFSNASFLSSQLSYKTFDVNVFGKGEQPLTLLPDGNTGDYFADTRRRSGRLQWQENYYLGPVSFDGQHSFKFGGEYDYTHIAGDFRYNPIFIRRHDLTLAQQLDFSGASTLTRNVGELAGFAQDRWVASPRLTIDAGVRFDRDGIVEQSHLAPRLSFLFLPLKSQRTILRGGIGLFYGRTPLLIGFMEALAEQLENEDGHQPESDSGRIASQASFVQLPERIVTTFAADGRTIVDGPRVFANEVDGALHNPRNVRWSLQLDQGFTAHLTGRVSFLQRTTVNDFIIDPVVGGPGAGALVLSSKGHSSYKEFQVLAAYNKPGTGNLNVSYVYSKALGDLNTADTFLSDFPAFVARANQYGPLPFDSPHRLLAYGELNAGHDIIIAPVLEIRSGFPFSVVNEELDFVGARNRAGRFPTYFSLDAQVTKGFRIPKFDKRKARIGIAVFNITNHFNPGDVQNNLGSQNFGRFYSSLGTSVRGKFEFDF